jgi:hypothetical protein
MALKPENPVVGGTVLRRAAIQSPNHVPGVSGWTVNQDGSAEFNNLTIRGVFKGTNFIINSSGAFFYSGPPALGNLIASITTTSGTESFGNNYQGGVTSYIGGNANGYVQMFGGLLSLVFQTAQFSAAQIQTQAQGQLIIGSGQTVSTDVGPSIQWLSRGANGGTAAVKAANVDEFALPPGAGPVIDGENWHTIGLAAGLTGDLSGGIGIRVKKTPWKAIWLDIEVNAAATGTFTCGSLPDASYYPNAARHFAIPSNNAAAQNARVFVPTAGALQIIVSGAAGAWGGGASVQYPTD